MKTITLKDNEVKLLLLLLKEFENLRSEMSCNDPEEKEKELFSKEEREDMMRIIGIDENHIKDCDGFMYNTDYPEYLRKLIKKQINNKT
jgi:hypothetical protein